MLIAVVGSVLGVGRGPAGGLGGGVEGGLGGGLAEWAAIIMVRASHAHAMTLPPGWGR